MCTLDGDEIVEIRFEYAIRQFIRCILDSWRLEVGRINHNGQWYLGGAGAYREATESPNWPKRQIAN